MAETLAIQLNDAPLASFSPEEMLAFLTANGKIDLRDVEDDMRKARKEQILKQHPYKIYQGSDGRWRTHIPDESKKEGRRLIVKSSLNDLETAVCEHYDSQKKSDTKESCTLEQLYPKWIEYKALHVKETTVIRVKKDWRRYYEGSPIVKKPIHTLTKLELDMWVHEMIREYEMDSHQYGNFSLIIRQMLEFAVDSEIASENKFLKVKVDKKRVLKPTRKKPDHTQVFNKTEEIKVVNRALEAFEKDEHYVQHFAPLGIVFLFYTGLRISELAALKFSDIDGKTLHVRRMVEYHTGRVVEDTKGTFGEREVPLCPEALSLILMVKAKREELGLDMDGYIFCPNDRPINTYSAMQRAIVFYCKDQNIDPKSIHKIRKTMISKMIDGGLNLNTSRQIAGHMDEKTTLNNYYFDRSDEEEKYNNFVRALS